MTLDILFKKYEFLHTPPLIYNNLSESLSQKNQGFQIPLLLKSPTFLSKTLDKSIEKCDAMHPLLITYFSIGGIFYVTCSLWQSC